MCEGKVPSSTISRLGSTSMARQRKGNTTIASQDSLVSATVDQPQGRTIDSLPAACLSLLHPISLVRPSCFGETWIDERKAGRCNWCVLFFPRWRPLFYPACGQHGRENRPAPLRMYPRRYQMMAASGPLGTMLRLHGRAQIHALGRYELHVVQ